MAGYVSGMAGYVQHIHVSVDDVSSLIEAIH